MPPPNLEHLLIQVDLFGGLADTVISLPENQGRHLFKSVGGVIFIPNSLTPRSIGLYFNQHPKDITRGFVFGSDPKTCDVLLANTKDTGISANHLSISIDWAYRIPVITCLSGNGLQIKGVGRTANAILPQNKWQRLISDTITNVHVQEGLGLQLLNPTRGDLQDAYDLNLQDYFLEYKNAVPELAKISLQDAEITPLVVYRCPGLEGRQYYTTEKFLTGDPEYDSKVFLYDAKYRPTPDTLVATRQREGGNNTQFPEGYEDTRDWLDNSKGSRPGQVFVIKHFRDKKTEAKVPSRFSELVRLDHVNIEDLVDIITETAAFMVVSDKFSHITLHALHHAEPLHIEETAFVLGQVFAALQYLHSQRWTHGNLDPRSIQVMSRKHLWIKLTDTALSSHVDLGKPEGYHALYASQANKGADQCAADVWSAGVVALQLLLPSGLPQRGFCQHYQWVHKVECTARSMGRRSATEATAFVQKVLMYEFENRPTATEVLEDPWIVRHRGEEVVNNFHFNCPTPMASRHTSVGPSNVFSRQGSAGPSDWSAQGSKASESRHASAGPSRRYNTQSLSIPREPDVQEEYTPIIHDVNKGSSSRGPSNDFSRQSSIDPNIIAALESRSHYGDEWNDFDSISEHGTSASRHSQGTARPLAPKLRSAMEDDLGGKARAQTGQGSRHSQSRSSGGGCSEQGSTTTQSSRFTANPLAREARLRTPTPTACTDIPGLSPRLGSIRSPPRSSAFKSPAASTQYDPPESSNKTSLPGPSHPQSHSKEVQALKNDEATGAVGPADGQRETEVSEDRCEEMETDEGAVVPSPAAKPRVRAKNGRFLKLRKGKGRRVEK